MSRLGEIQVLLDHLSNETNLLHQAKLIRKIQKMFKEQAECVEKLEEHLKYMEKDKLFYQKNAYRLEKRVNESENTIKAHDHSNSLNATVAGENMNLRVENQRYKKALENALYFVKCSRHEPDKARIMQEFIERALKEDDSND